MKVTKNYFMSAADLPSGYTERFKESIKKFDLKNRQNPNEGNPVPVTAVDPSKDNPYMTKLELSRDEANLMNSFRLEEYVELTRKMQDSDPEAYRLHMKRLQEAKDRGDISAKIREYTMPYTWAYGDILDTIHKCKPELDVYIRSEGTPKDFEFRKGQEKRKNRPYLVISTDEIRLLQSKDTGMKEKQEKLWEELWDRIKQ